MPSGGGGGKTKTKNNESEYKGTFRSGGGGKN